MMSRCASSAPGRCEYPVTQASRITKMTVSFFMCFLLEIAGVYYILSTQKEGVHGVPKSKRIPRRSCGFASCRSHAGTGPGCANNDYRAEGYVRQYSPGQHGSIRLQGIV